MILWWLLILLLKRKKTIFSDVPEKTSTEQLELLSDDEVTTGRDLAGYILIKQEVYQSLLDSQNRLQQLQSLLK